MEHVKPVVTLSPPCSHLLARFLYTHKSFSTSSCAMMVSQLMREYFFLAHVSFVKDCQPSDSLQSFPCLHPLRSNELELTTCLASHRDQKVVVSRCKIPVGLDGLPNVTDS